MADLAIKDGGVQVKNGELCLACTCWPVHDPGPNDCCCFLDPTTLTWDEETTYGINDLVKYGSGTPAKTYRSLQNGNLNHVVADTDWWEIASEAVECDNEEWDSVAPFGGPGKTPYVYTVNLRIVWQTTGWVTRFHTYCLKTPIDNICHHWVMPFPTPPAYCSDGQLYRNVRVMLRGGLPWTYWYKIFYVSTWNWPGPGCNYDGLQVGEYRFCHMVDYPTDVEYCQLEWASAGATPHCAVRRVDLEFPPYDYEMGLVDVVWHPGQISEWDECTDYEVGDMVAWNAVFYVCIQAHAAGSPPTCAGSKEPPNASYWDVV